MISDNQNVRKILRYFVNDPEDFWRENPRQLKKSSSRIARLANHYGWGCDSLVEVILCLAEQRVKAKTKTIYLSSFGSSGSHLIQHVLVESYGMIGLGEVYLPETIERILNDADFGEKWMLLESYHLLHSPPENIFKNKCMINTAHKARLQTFSSSTASFVPVFIARNPVELAISRSFRKGEYRSYLGKSEISDEDYLKENLIKTKRFYQSAFSFPYKNYLFFEDINENQRRLAKELALISGGGGEDVALESLRQALKVGATNKYDGPKAVISECLIDLAERELSDISKKFDKLRIDQVDTIESSDI